jgi:hypothetical protein
VLQVAVVVLVLFAALFVYMIVELGAGESRWTRLVFLYGTVEAIVFAAAGAIFGTQVQRANVDRAERRAADAQQRADGNAEAAAGGKALSRTVKAARDAAGGGSPPGTRSRGLADGAPSELERLGTIAETLFPD